MALEWPGSQSHSSHRTCFLSVTPEACSYTQVCLFFNQPPSQPHGILRKTRENSAGKAYLFPSIFLFWKEEDDWTNDSSFSFLFKKMAQDVIIPSERCKLFWKQVCPQAVCWSCGDSFCYKGSVCHCFWMPGSWVLSLGGGIAPPPPPRRQDVLYILIGRLQNRTHSGVSAPPTFQGLLTFY